MEIYQGKSFFFCYLKEEEEGEKKAAVLQSGRSGHARLLALTPARSGPAKDMRRLQAVNKVEPIGWRSAIVPPSMLCGRWPGIVGMWRWS